MNCLFCMKELPDDANFCKFCGKKIPRCPTCATVLRYRSSFCPEDGTPLPPELTQALPELKPSQNETLRLPKIIKPMNAPPASRCTKCGKPCPPGVSLCAQCARMAQGQGAPIAPPPAPQPSAPQPSAPPPPAPPPPAPPPPAPQPPKQTQDRKPFPIWAAALCVLLLLAVIGGGIWWWKFHLPEKGGGDDSTPPAVEVSPGADTEGQTGLAVGPAQNTGAESSTPAAQSSTEPPSTPAAQETTAEPSTPAVQISTETPAVQETTAEPSTPAAQSSTETPSTPAVQSSTEEQSAVAALPERLFVGTWDGKRRLQGLDWNTDTMDTYYISNSSYISAYSLAGERLAMTKQVKGYLYSLDYYDGKVFSIMRPAGHGKFKLRIYDASTMELSSSIILSDIREAFSADKKKYGDDLAPSIDAVSVAYRYGGGSDLKLYVSYNCYHDGANSRAIHNKQKIFEYDYKSVLANPDDITAEHIYEVDTGKINYGIQTMEFDWETNRMWFAVRKGESDYSLYCIDWKTGSRLKNGDKTGWNCRNASDGFCCLGEDSYYVMVPSYGEGFSSANLIKVQGKDLEKVSKLAAKKK